MLAQLEAENATLVSASTAAAATAASTAAAKAESAAARAERDERSVFVGGVHASATAEELSREFESCGVVERVTIVTDPHTGYPKGCVRRGGERVPPPAGDA